MSTPPNQSLPTTEEPKASKSTVDAKTQDQNSEMQPGRFDVSSSTDDATATSHPGSSSICADSEKAASIVTAEESTLHSATAAYVDGSSCYPNSDLSVTTEGESGVRAALVARQIPPASGLLSEESSVQVSAERVDRTRMDPNLPFSEPSSDQYIILLGKRVSVGRGVSQTSSAIPMTDSPTMRSRATKRIQPDSGFEPNQGGNKRSPLPDDGQGKE